jgi:hypothetical protein
VLLLGLFLLVLFLVSSQPPGADETGYAFLMLFFVSLTALSELAALGLGIAGMLQRRHKRSLAFFGVACSVLVLVVINSHVGLARIASMVVTLTEPQPKVHVVSPGNE